MKREILYKIIRFLLNALADVRFEGTEYIPEKGGVIVATNHISRIDTPVLFLSPKRSDIIALVADKYKHHILFSWLVNGTGCIWIDRSRADFSAFSGAIAALKSGQALGISPEGTRSKTGELQEGKSGVVLLALKAGVPILPVAITGTRDLFKNAARFQRAQVTARFGPLIHLAPLNRDEREEGFKRYTDEVMCRIAALLPEENRGYYINHPRLKEFLSATSI